MKKPKINLFDFAVELLILIVVFVMPAIFDRRLGIVFSGTKIAWLRAFGSIILGVWAGKLIITRHHRFIRTALDWPVLSFLLCTTVAALTSVHVYTSFAGFYGRYEGLTSWYLFGLSFFVVTNYIRSFEQLKRIIVTVLSAATLMAVYSVIQRHELDPYMWGGVVTWQRVIGTIGQPNFLAAYMIMAFFLIFSLLLMEKEKAGPEIDWYSQLIPLCYFLFGQIAFLVMIYTLEAQNVLLWYLYFSAITASALLFTFSYEKLHPWIFNLLLGLCLLLIYISILYTQSRGGYLGFFTGAVVFGLVAGRRWIFSSFKKILALGFAIVLVSGVTMCRPEFSPLQRFSSEITTEKEKTAEEAEIKVELKGAAGSRGETWKSAFRIVADYPFFGIGPEVLKMVFPRYETELFRFKEAFHVKQDRCHNETFDVAVTKGLLAFFAYLWLLFMFFKVGLQKAKTLGGGERLLTAGLLSAAFAYLIQNQFSFGVVAITSLFWIIWGMVMVVGDEGPARPAGGQGTIDEGRRISWMEIPWLPVAGVVILVLFLSCVSFFSFRGDVWFKSGKTKMEMRGIREGVADLEKSLKVFPFEGGTVSHLGIGYLNLSHLSRNSPEKVGFLNKAIAVLKYGIEIDPYNADNFYMLSKVFLMLSEMGNPLALAEAKNYAESALKIDPYYAEVYNTLGMIYEKQNRPEEAAQQFEKSFLINPHLSEPMNRLKDIYQKTQKTSEMLKVFERALEKYSQHLLILEKLARLYLDYGKIEEALSLCQRMIGIDSNFSPGYVLRAEVYLRKGKLDPAFSDFQQVILNDPKNIAAHEGLARLYLAKGERQRAKEEFEQILMLDAENAFARKMLGR